jgi:hypothetical protein
MQATPDRDHRHARHLIKALSSERGRWLLLAAVFASASWRIGHRLSAQQVQFALAYLFAKAELWLGFDRLGLVHLSFHDGHVAVTRAFIATVPRFASDWRAFWSAAQTGAVVPIVLIVLAFVLAFIADRWLTHEPTLPPFVPKTVATPHCSPPVNPVIQTVATHTVKRPPRIRNVVAEGTTEHDERQTEFDFSAVVVDISAAPIEGSPSALPAAPPRPVRLPGRVRRDANR